MTEPPRQLVRDLEAQAVDVVVGPVDPHDGRAVGERVLDLGRLEVGGNEHVGRDADRGSSGGRRAREVSGARAAERLEAEGAEPGRGDRDRPILERQRRVAGVVLDQQPFDADRRTEPVRAHQGRAADLEPALGWGVDRKELEVAPDARSPARDRVGGDEPAHQLQVDVDLERAEARGTDVARTDGLGRAAVATPEAADAGRRRGVAGGSGEFDGHGTVLSRMGRSDRQMRRPSTRRVPGGSPYLAGEPARNWHLAGSAPVGCRGFNGPVPPPLLIALFSWRDGTNPDTRPSRAGPRRLRYGCTRRGPRGPGAGQLAAASTSADAAERAWSASAGASADGASTSSR